LGNNPIWDLAQECDMEGHKDHGEIHMCVDQNGNDITAKFKAQCDECNKCKEEVLKCCAHLTIDKDMSVADAMMKHTKHKPGNDPLSCLVEWYTFDCEFAHLNSC
jgi:hypothetical protein